MTNKISNYITETPYQYVQYFNILQCINPSIIILVLSNSMKENSACYYDFLKEATIKFVFVRVIPGLCTDSVCTNVVLISWMYFTK